MNKRPVFGNVSENRFLCEMIFHSVILNSFKYMTWTGNLMKAISVSGNSH